MELLAVDISLLVISLIVATAVILLFSFSSEISYKKSYFIESFAVIDFVRYVKNLCPISFGKKWRLLPLNLGLPRCWTKNVLLPGFQNSFNLCGVSCAVPCSTVYAFSVIADVSKWNEWDHLSSSQCLLVKPFFESELKKDAFMQADQIVGVQRGTDVQSYIAIYRFMSFSEETVKWILFWNIKKLEFLFFLIQPAVSKADYTQCLITHVFGSSTLSSHVTISVAQRLKNIQEFLLLSQLHIIASNCGSAVPARQHSNMLKTEESLEVETSNKDIHHKFVLVPIMRKLTCAYKSLNGFKLTVVFIDTNSRQKELNPSYKKQQKVQSQSAMPTKLEQRLLKRTSSENCIKPKYNPDFSSNLELNTYSCKNDIKSPKRRNSIIVEEIVQLDLNTKKNIESKAFPEQPRSFSDPTTPLSNVMQHKSSGHSEDSDTHINEESYIHLHIIHDDTSPVNNCDKSDILCSSTSEFELMDSNQHFLAYKMADFLTQGNYGASELQAEMVLASQYDKTLSPDEQTGVWTYHSSYKGFTVLSKTTAGQVMKIISFLCQTELPVECTDVWKCVKNPRFRFIYDESVKNVKIVERISDSQKLIYVYHEVNSGILRKEAVDFCLLQTEREEATQFYSSFLSMEYEKCPIMTSVLRGSLRPSGWVVEDLGPKKCKVTYLTQVLVNSSDSPFIDQLSTSMPLALHNLKNYIMSIPS